MVVFSPKVKGKPKIVENLLHVGTIYLFIVGNVSNFYG